MICDLFAVSVAPWLRTNSYALQPSCLDLNPDSFNVESWASYILSLCPSFLCKMELKKAPVIQLWGLNEFLYKQCLEHSDSCLLIDRPRQQEPIITIWLFFNDTDWLHNNLPKEHQSLTGTLTLSYHYCINLPLKYLFQLKKYT